MTGEFARFFRGLGINGVEVAAVRWVRHAFAPHMHDFYALSVNDAGTGAFDCRHGRRDAVPGTCNLIAPGEWHTGHPTSPEGWGYRNIHVDPEAMARLLRDLEWKGPPEISFRSPLVGDPVLAQRLRGALASFENPDAFQLEREARLMSVVARLVTHHASPDQPLRSVGREPRAVRQAMEWIEAHACKRVSLRSLAAAASLSPCYLVRTFRCHVGVTPHTYHTIVRTHRARALLLAGVPVAVAALETGFCDQSHLTRCFKRILGVTPGQYVVASADARSNGDPRVE